MKSKILLRILLFMVVIAVFLISACLPFAEQGELSKELAKQVDASDFYSDTVCGERAMIISENVEALAERIRLIANARQSIVLSTFDMKSDDSGKLVIAALMEAADRGVTVKLMLDGFSYFTHAWGNPYFLAFAGHENVDMRVYNPVNLFTPWTLMARMHDKYLIVDDTTYILGGRNIYDYFLGDHDGYKNYDWDVLVHSTDAEDSSLYRLKDYFLSVWNTKDCTTIGKNVFWRKNPSVVNAGSELRDILEETRKLHGEWFDAVDYGKVTVETNRIRLVANPAHTGVKEPVVYYTVTELMAQPGEAVTFHTPYILCNDWMLRRLKEVCAVNPSVTMMTNSVANNGNPFGSADYQIHKGEILETGLRILEYDSGVSYHGKCFTVGERLSGVGSFNWDMRSAYIDTELMLVIDSPELNASLRDAMAQYEEESFTVIDEDTYKSKPGAHMQPISRQRQNRINLLRLFVDKLRFLM